MDIEWTCEMLLDVFETVEDSRLNIELTANGWSLCWNKDA